MCVCLIPLIRPSLAGLADMTVLAKSAIQLQFSQQKTLLRLTFPAL